MNTPKDQPDAPEPAQPPADAPSPPSDSDELTRPDTPAPPSDSDQAEVETKNAEPAETPVDIGPVESAAAPPAMSHDDAGVPPAVPPEPEVEEVDLSETDEEPPFESRKAGKKLMALFLAALLLLGAIFGYRFLFQPGTGDRQAGDRQAGDRQAGDRWAWTALPFPPIDPRYGHAAVWTGTSMIVWGGFSGVAAESGLRGAGIRSDGAQIEPGQGSWEIVPPAPVAHRPDMPPVWTGKEMIAWGGDPSQPAQGVAYDPESRSWRSLPPTPLPARGGQTAVWTGTELLLWGGRVAALDRPGEQPDISSSGAAFDPATSAWREIPPGPLAPRDAHSAVWTGKEMIVWGGYGAPDAGGSAQLSDGGAFDPVANRWRTVPPAPAALEASVTWSGEEMLVWGDRLVRPASQEGAISAPSPSETPQRARARYVMEGLAYNPQRDRWRRLASPGFGLRTGARAQWSGPGMVVWGGFIREAAESAASGPANDGAVYHPGSNRWEPVPTSPIKGRDTGFSMVPTDDGVIIWGGKASERGGRGTTLADGARLTLRGG